MRNLGAVALAMSLAGAFTRVSAQEVQAQLWDAAIAGDTAAITLAVKNGANVHTMDTRRSMNGRRALNWAALGNHVAAIRVLLSAGASVDSVNYTGFTPLHHAAEVGATEAAEALLNAGARANVMNAAGQTPAQVARERGFEKLALLLEQAEKRKQP